MAVASLFIAVTGNSPFHRADMRRLPVTSLPAAGAQSSCSGILAASL